MRIEKATKEITYVLELKEGPRSVKRRERKSGADGRGKPEGVETRSSKRSEATTDAAR